MNITDAYHVLKSCIEFDIDTQEAYNTVIQNQEDYRIITKQFCDEIKASIKMGQSMLALGELVKEFYNATHRQIKNEIIDLPGSEFCKDIGEVANIMLQQIIEINQMTEEWATTQTSCNKTCDVSYM